MPVSILTESNRSFRRLIKPERSIRWEADYLNQTLPPHNKVEPDVKASVLLGDTVQDEEKLT